MSLTTHTSFYLITRLLTVFLFFFFNDTATTEIYTLSLHDALPISFGNGARGRGFELGTDLVDDDDFGHVILDGFDHRSEEHTSELQSQSNLVCRLLLEKKKFLLTCIVPRSLCVLLLAAPLWRLVFE